MSLGDYLFIACKVPVLLLQQNMTYDLLAQVICGSVNWLFCEKHLKIWIHIVKTNILHACYLYIPVKILGIQNPIKTSEAENPGTKGHYVIISYYSQKKFHFRETRYNIHQPDLDLFLLKQFSNWLFSYNIGKHPHPLPCVQHNKSPPIPFTWNIWLKLVQWHHPLSHY